LSFEFNPNKNLDRSEDDNEPQDDDRLGGERGPFGRGVPGVSQVVGACNHQDNVSLGGDGGLFDRVPGGSQVGAANRSQGQARDGPGQDQGLPFGDQGLPFERQGLDLARGGLDQARGGQALRSVRQAEGLLGMLGRILSHVSGAASAASASVIPISEYFGTQKRQAVEINARRVICPKHAPGDHGSRDYAHHQEATAKALPYPFASAKHFHAKNAEGEAANKYANLQSEYAENLAKIKTLKRRMGAWE